MKMRSFIILQLILFGVVGNVFSQSATSNLFQYDDYKVINAFSKVDSIENQILTGGSTFINIRSISSNSDSISVFWKTFSPSFCGCMAPGCIGLLSGPVGTLVSYSRLERIKKLKSPRDYIRGLNGCIAGVAIPVVIWALTIQGLIIISNNS